MSMALVCLGCTFQLMTLSAIALSVRNGVGGCTWSSSSIHIWLVSAFSGLTVHTNCPCVTSFMHSASTLCWKIKSMLLVGFIMQPTTYNAICQSFKSVGWWKAPSFFCISGCSLVACSWGACPCPCPILPWLDGLHSPVMWWSVWGKPVRIDAIAVSWLLRHSLDNVMTVACPTVVSINYLKKGV